ncbi:5-formyltetrahydrofolate cyclo-ligase [Paraglaciecola aquimarina]|uniref:5-formyltetrahydrofolate cyclo-ligase n=1 Tax=Paraglaciecola aquimarina TaxID=1235557 RepID=A0ABU3SWF5_9ALTE|nr:5-formyltetrahydrofolate cyclo-ligase [Paraglaciecola aquimarina]MDU0354334.1 5-formyltetrahydrofolate cyclo-ligase [Paraglaciecola aquimarina]
MTPSDTLKNRQALRRQYRQLRNQLSDEQQITAASSCLSVCLQSTTLSRAKIVSCYLANDGELDPQALMQFCWQHNIQVLLPVLDPAKEGHLIFVDYQPTSPTRANVYGIPEPIITIDNTVPIENIDLIFTPLVAFDNTGNRLGMGGGYYDRTLAAIVENKLSTQLIGLAHECQQAIQLPTDSWDIPLNGIATPAQFFKID